MHESHPSPGRLPGGFEILPRPRTAAGALRRVGVEIEFTGISVRDAARALGRWLGREPVEEDPHAYLVPSERLGDLLIELDVRHVHAQRRDPTLPWQPGPRSATVLGWALSRVVPRELVTGPLGVEQLGEVDAAIAVLRAAGATGRGATAFGSLGLHFNVDPPRTDARTLAAFLKALLLLEPELRRGSAGGGSESWPYLPAPYPRAYARRVVAPDYWPDLATFADDYLAANPTRDRSLDLLPVLLHLDPERVRARLPHEKIGNRPVLHYRLPQARVGEPGWGLSADWNRWVAVERLAADPERLHALGRADGQLAGRPRERTGFA